MRSLIQTQPSNGHICGRPLGDQPIGVLAKQRSLLWENVVDFAKHELGLLMDVEPPLPSLQGQTREKRFIRDLLTFSVSSNFSTI